MTGVNCQWGNHANVQIFKGQKGRCSNFGGKRQCASFRRQMAVANEPRAKNLLGVRAWSHAVMYKIRMHADFQSFGAKKPDSLSKSFFILERSLLDP